MGGGDKLAMADLRAFISFFDFDDVQTVLQSGNALFRGIARTARNWNTVLKLARLAAT